MGEGRRRWGYIRIMCGTIFGGILGFYYMHRAELSYKEKWNQRLKKYEEEMNKKKELEAAVIPNEFEESL